MSTEVKIGQVWKDKDKRRSTVIEIIEVGSHGDVKLENGEVVGLVVGTEETRIYQSDRLVKRWTMTKEAPEPKSALDEELEELLKNSAPKAPKRKTREQWLEAAVKLIIKQIFTPASVEVPEVRVSVGWPGGRGPKKNVIGQCFAARTTADKVAQIFVTPAIDDAYTTVETLAHEIIHAIAVDEDGVSAGHRGEFIRIAKEIGFTAPWKSTPASEELREKLQAIADKLGVYPHAAINVGDRPTVQKTYYLLLESVDCDTCPDGYKLRMTEKWIEEAGSPLCPHGIEMSLPE